MTVCETLRAPRSKALQRGESKASSTENAKEIGVLSDSQTLRITVPEYELTGMILPLMPHPANDTTPAGSPRR